VEYTTRESRESRDVIDDLRPTLPQLVPERITPRRDRNDMIEPIERHEAIDSIEPADAIEPTDRTEPIEPTDRAEPTEPIDKTEPLEAIERTEFSDQNDSLLVLRSAGIEQNGKPTSQRRSMSTAPPEPLTPTHVGDHVIYAVAGGNHVSVLLDRSETASGLDVIEVLAQPGGGPPPHRHAFAEWFRVLEGELTFAEERDGSVRCTSTLGPGETVFVSPWTVHGTLNLSDAPARFEVVGQPGAMTGYFREAGVQVPDERTPPEREPPGPADLRAISERWGIEFWAGPIDRTALHDR
jgi:quercetin dioxygenase-like cupin family protein